MADLKKIEKEDPLFVQDLMDSIPYVVLAGRFLRWLDHSYKISIPETVARPEIGKMAEYSDDGDLLAWHPDWDSWLTFGVKHRFLEFQGTIEYPYPTVLVDNVHNYEKTDPIAYIIFNLNATGLLIVKAESFDTWTIADYEDRGRIRRSYFAPKSVCRWHYVPPRLLEGITFPDQERRAAERKELEHKLGIKGEEDEG